jgi:hypothetical protein
MTTNVYVIGPNYSVPNDALIINTTSRSSNWSRGLSPFVLGPVELYDGYVAKNVENAWQYSKFYEYYAESDGSIGERYFKWARDGWNNPRAVRRPMDREAVPLCAYWAGERLSYIEARKKIYMPLYAGAVKKSAAFAKLQSVAEKHDVYLWDFDGYNHKELNLSYEDVINNPHRSMGHGFVVAMLLEGYLK